MAIQLFRFAHEGDEVQDVRCGWGKILTVKGAHIVSVSSARLPVASQRFDRKLLQAYVTPACRLPGASGSLTVNR